MFPFMATSESCRLVGAKSLLIGGIASMISAVVTAVCGGLATAPRVGRCFVCIYFHSILMRASCQPDIVLHFQMLIFLIL